MTGTQPQCPVGKSICHILLIYIKGCLVTVTEHEIHPMGLKQIFGSRCHALEQTPEARYKHPNQKYFVQKVVPELYRGTETKAVKTLR